LELFVSFMTNRLGLLLHVRGRDAHIPIHSIRAIAFTHSYAAHTVDAYWVLGLYAYPYSITDGDRAFCTAIALRHESAIIIATM